MGNAWADVASADDTAHALAECANRVRSLPAPARGRGLIIATCLAGKL